MKVSEKSLELNIGAELLWWLRRRPGLRKAYLRGLTQREERAEGVDFFAQLSPKARLFAFQFKAPKGNLDKVPYRFTLVRHQHRALHKLAKANPSSVFYVFPFYVGARKLQKDCPQLLADTWFLDVRTMSQAALFGGQLTRTVTCLRGTAAINPEYPINTIDRLEVAEGAGVPAREFASWYAEFRMHGHRSVAEERDAPLRRGPWMARGLRVAVVAP